MYIDGKHMFVNRLGGLFVYSMEKDVSVRLPFPGYGSGEARLVNGETYVIEFAARGYGKKSYSVDVTQLEGYFSTLAP